jgi:hypothetical protein
MAGARGLGLHAVRQSQVVVTEKSKKTQRKWFVDSKIRLRLLKDPADVEGVQLFVSFDIHLPKHPGGIA